VFGLLLYVFRPRRQWPEYFGMSIGGMYNNTNIAQIVENLEPIA